MSAASFCEQAHGKQISVEPARIQRPRFPDRRRLVPARDGRRRRQQTYEIVDVYGLQGIGSSSYLLSQSYKLVNDIDASGTVHWNDGKGFKPIGSGGYYNEFTGSLNGQNFVVNGLHINSGDAQHVGLFGYIGYSGSVSNLGIVNANVTSTYSDNHGSVGDPRRIPCCGRHYFKRLHHGCCHRCHCVVRA